LIYVLKVTANQERVVAEILYREARVKRKEGTAGEVYAILYTTGLKGYIMIEADSPGTVEELARNVPKTKGLLLHRRGEIESAGTISMDELKETLMPTPIVESLNKGDLVELVSGPFKSEKARVARIDHDKNEITVELIEAAVPIPVIVKGDDIKILKKQGDAD